MSNGRFLWGLEAMGAEERLEVRQLIESERLRTDERLAALESKLEARIHERASNLVFEFAMWGMLIGWVVVLAVVLAVAGGRAAR